MCVLWYRIVSSLRLGSWSRKEITDFSADRPITFRLIVPAWFYTVQSRKGMQMKPISWLGILLVILGALALAYQGFSYTRQEKVLDLGPIHATREDHEWVSIPPILGGLALVGGIALIVAGRKSS